MPECQKQPASRPKQKLHSLQESKAMRKLRIICDDPDATDSSDDDSKRIQNPRIVKRSMCEISLLPLLHTFTTLETSSCELNNKKNTMRVSTKGQPQSKKRVLTHTPSTRRKTPGKYRGVRQRKWGKWASEIYNPFQNNRIWLGTFNTAEEASQVYEARRLELEAMAKAQAYKTGSGSAGEPLATTSDKSNCCNSSAAAAAADVSVSEKFSTTSDDIEESVLPHNSPPSVIEKGNVSTEEAIEANYLVDDLAGLEIPDLSLLNLPPPPSVIEKGNVSTEEAIEANYLVDDLAGLEIPDLSLLNLPPPPSTAGAAVPSGIEPNSGLDFDWLSFDDYEQAFDDFGGLEDIHISGFDDNEPSELPDFDFGDFDAD
ncbi:Ethylene-responsive transcription factor ERF118 [Glycine soja]|nr:hypothetical protein JHK87_047478 [Glycine soja]